MDNQGSRNHSCAHARALIAAAQQGDHQALHELLRRYEPLIQRIVWKLKLPPSVDRDDLAQEARIGLLAAIRAWNPRRGPFPAFADRCATNQALLAIQAACRHKHKLLTRAVPLDGPQTSAAPRSDNWRNLTLLDTIPAGSNARTDPETHLLIREELSSLVGALPTLTHRERAALAGILAGDSYQELARKLQATPKAASQAAGRARRKLASALPKAA